MELAVTERPAATFFLELPRRPPLVPLAPVGKAERGYLRVKLAAEELAVVRSRTEAKGARVAMLVTRGMVATVVEVGVAAPPLPGALQAMVGTAVQAGTTNQKTEEMAVAAAQGAPRRRALPPKEAKAEKAAKAVIQMVGLLRPPIPKLARAARVARAERLGSAKQMVVKLAKAARVAKAARDLTAAPTHAVATAAVVALAKEKEARAVMVEASGPSIATVMTARRGSRSLATKRRGPSSLLVVE